MVLTPFPALAPTTFIFSHYKKCKSTMYHVIHITKNEKIRIRLGAEVSTILRRAYKTITLKFLANGG